MQNHYNLVYREEERELMPTLKVASPFLDKSSTLFSLAFICNLYHFGVGSIPWSPLARGVLTRPVDADKTTRGSGDFFKPDNYLNANASGKEMVRR